MVMIIQKSWEWIRREGKVLIVLLTATIAFFTGLSAYLDWKDFIANQNVREYITGLRKRELNIDLGNGEYMGGKLLVDDLKTPYGIDWYWRRNTEPSQITTDNAERVTSMAIPGNAQNEELLKDLFQGR